VTAELIDGRAISRAIREEVQASAAAFAAQHGLPPTLAVVWAGSDAASERYTREIRRDFERRGLAIREFPLSERVPERDLVALLQSLGVDQDVHGVLVQTPLPTHMDVERVSLAIPVRKDVDGVHPVNAGFLFGNSGHTLAPATPAGGVELLDRIGVSARGKRAVIVGRSPNVGKPMAILLLHRNATVTICHSHTERLPEVVAEAEILVAATGVPHLIKGEWLRPGVVVIDFGFNVIDGQTLGDHAGSGWDRADDGRDAHAEHAARGAQPDPGSDRRRKRLDSLNARML
jgi:methylenetetrahydrofolate dehydrogenase (NADP+)/methenyltetrahydrofolate cyclohydrolase